MRVFVYEFVTGGGFLGAGWGAPPKSLLREGAAMVSALAADFAALEGTQVVVLRDSRQSGPEIPGVRVYGVDSADEERSRFAKFAAECDSTVVIAPELSGVLLDRCREVERAGGRLLGPGSGLVELASDKHATAEWLRSAGVPLPDGRAVAPGQPLPPDFAFPAVGKPRWGAGSQGVQRLADRKAAADWIAGVTEPSRLERFCPGVAASVALVCGPKGLHPLVPCRQRLSDDGRFVYQGGSLPLEAPLARRAVDLATRAVRALAEPTGYLGVDLVLGADTDGRDDVVIEVNPRLTTSYVGLRAAASPGTNLAAAMLAACEGRTPQLSFRPVEVQFDPDGSAQLSAISSQLPATSRQMIAPK
jgi:tyramine---L-glutamate ligase